MPDECSNMITFSKDFITEEKKISNFRIINTDKNSSVFGEQLLEESEPRVHHAEPFVVTSEVLALFSDNFTEPLPDLRIVDVIVINPAFIAGVIGRIDVDTFYSAFIPREQGFESFEVVTPDDHVLTAVVFIVLTSLIKAVFPVKYSERHILMMIDDLAFSDPVQCRHGVSPRKEKS